MDSPDFNDTSEHIHFLFFFSFSHFFCFWFCVVD